MERLGAGSQQQAVYNWESSWRGWITKSAGKRDVRRAIRRAERLYRVPPVPVVFKTRSKNREGRRLASGYHITWLEAGWITLRPHHQNVPIGLHEAAHRISHYFFGWDPPGFEDHGPQWLGIYLCLLADAGVAPRTALEASAAAAGLRWRSPAWVGPRAIRRRYRAVIRRAKAAPLYTD